MDQPDSLSGPISIGALPSFSSKRHRYFFESIHEPTLVLRPLDEVVLAANQSACELFQVPRAELLGSPLKLLSTDSAHTHKHIRATLDGLTRHVFQTTQTRADGTTLHLEISAAPVWFDGEVAILAISRDIGARIAERELRRHAERIELSQKIGRAALSGASLRAVAREALQLLVERTRADRASIVLFDRARGVGELVADVGPNPTSTHEGTIPLARWDPDKLDHRAQPRYLADLHKSDRSTLEGELLNRGIRCIFTVPLRNEEELFGELNLGSKLPDAFGKRERAHTIAMTHELGVAIRGAQLRRALMEERQRMRDLIANLPEGVVLLDTDANTLVANELGRELLGLVMKASGAVLPMDAGPQQMVVEQDGRIIESKMRQLSTSDSHKAGWVLLLSDISEEQAMQRKLREQDRLAAVGQLAAGVAHDFNNLLQGISSYAELALTHAELPQDVIASLLEITTQTRRGKTLVRQILDFGRRSLSSPSVVDMVQLVADGIALLKHVLPTTLQLRYTAPKAALHAEVDPVQMQQVLTNLALNARDAMPGGGTLDIELFSEVIPAHEETARRSAGSWVVLRVSDSGHGIPNETLSRIFEPFFTTKAPQAGTGLGLAQVYGIVQQHGGHLSVDSTLDHGSTFTIHLPRSTPPSHTSSPVVRPAATRGAGELVMLVEDDPALRKSIPRVLRTLGYRVVSADNGAEALELMDQHLDEIALVVTDVVMPVMSGIELSAALRADHPELPVILTTGYPLNETHEAYAHDYIWLHKPFSAAEIGTAIAQALGGDAN